MTQGSQALRVPAAPPAPRPHAATTVAGQGGANSTEFLTLLTESLSFAPTRGDLWMMRFDCWKSLGMKREFAEGITAARASPEVQQQLDWPLLKSMWEELSSGQALPGQPAVPSVMSTQAIALSAAQAAVGMARTRRFNDIAMKLASTELAELARLYGAICIQTGFLQNFARKTAPFLRRPTPLEYHDALSNEGGVMVRIFLKREDARRGISAEMDHAAAQCYIASLLNKPAVVTGNDVDAHALAIAQVAPLFRQRCTVVVKPQDFAEKADLISRLQALGATVEKSPDGMIGTDPREGALRLWQANQAQFHLALSLGTAPAPYTAMMNNFSSLVGRETESQFLTQGGGLASRKRTMVAAVGSEADSIGFVLPLLNRKEIEVVYAEPAPGGTASWRPSVRLKPYNGQIREHSWLRASRRIEHVAVAEEDAARRQDSLARQGLSISLEDSRAVELALNIAKRANEPRDFVILVA